MTRLKYITDTSRNKHRNTIHKIYRWIHSKVTNTSTGFSICHSDHNVYTKKVGNHLIILVLYVGRLILTSSDHKIFIHLKSNFKKKFEIWNDRLRKFVLFYWPPSPINQWRNISQKHWVEEIDTVVHIVNKAHLRPKNDKTPYELWFGRHASIKHFKVFGSKCYIKNNDEHLGKYDDRADEAMLLGYVANSKGYTCYNMRLHKLVDCIDIKIDEGIHVKHIQINSVEPDSRRYSWR